MPTFLIFNAAEAVQYADIGKGDLRMDVVIPTAPTANDNRKWGFFAPSKGSGLYFQITGTTFQAVAIDGPTGADTTVSITFETEWVGTEQVYRIVWEAGLAHFYVAGTKKATIAFEDDNLDLASIPLSVYVYNANADNMLVGYVEALGVQSYI